MGSLGKTYNDDSSQRKVMDGKPLPNGVYMGRVARTEQKATQNRDGTYLEIEIDIVDPSEYQNRKVWDRINFDNPSAQTVAIATEQLEDIRQAAGLQQLTHDEELMDKLVKMEIVVKFAEEYIDSQGQKRMGKDGNKILKYWHPNVNVEAEREKRSGKRSTASASLQYRDAPAAQQAPAQTTWGAQAQPQQQEPNAAPQTQQQGGSMAWKKHAPK